MNGPRLPHTVFGPPDAQDQRHMSPFTFSESDAPLTASIKYLQPQQSRETPLCTNMYIIHILTVEVNQLGVTVFSTTRTVPLRNSPPLLRVPSCRFVSVANEH